MSSSQRAAAGTICDSITICLVFYSSPLICSSIMVKGSWWNQCLHSNEKISNDIV